MKKINIVLLLVVAGVFAGAFTLLFVVDLVEESSTYTDFVSAKQMDKKVHVVGQWVKKEDFSYSGDMNVLNFWMQDTLNNVSRVRYNDPMPPNFESAEKVVVIGKYKEDVFEADQILMKCPSKYNEGEEAIEGAGIQHTPKKESVVLNEN